MSNHQSISRAAQKMVADILRADTWFDEHRCTIVEQDSAELAFLLEKSMAAIRGPVIVVGTDRLRNENPASEAEVFVAVTEIVTTNRKTGNFCTAIEAAEAAVDDLDGSDWHWDGDISHETPDEKAVLLARCSFKALLAREPGDDPLPTGPSPTGP